MSDKPREWWLEEDPKELGCTNVTFDDPRPAAKGWVYRVIEYSAYTELKAKFDRLSETAQATDSLLALVHSQRIEASAQLEAVTKELADLQAGTLELLEVADKVKTERDDARKFYLHSDDNFYWTKEGWDDYQKALIERYELDKKSDELFDSWQDCLAQLTQVKKERDEENLRLEKIISGARQTILMMENSISELRKALLICEHELLEERAPYG